MRCGGDLNKAIAHQKFLCNCVVMSRMSLRSFTEGDEPLLFGKSALGNILDPEFETGEPEPEVDIPEGATISAEPWRWLVLFSFCFAAWINSILWITFAPIAVATEDFYGISPFEVNGSN